MSCVDLLVVVDVCFVLWWGEERQTGAHRWYIPLFLLSNLPPPRPSHLPAFPERISGTVGTPRNEATTPPSRNLPLCGEIQHPKIAHSILATRIHIIIHQNGLGWLLRFWGRWRRSHFKRPDKFEINTPASTIQIPQPIRYQSQNTRWPYPSWWSKEINTSYRRKLAISYIHWV